ncbi:hypothetical protein HB904_18300, partial [Listeria booriae]
SNNATFTDIIRSEAADSLPNGANRLIDIDFVAKSDTTYIGLGNQSDSIGKYSKMRYFTPELQRINLGAPSISPLTARDSSVTVSGEPNAVLTIVLPNGEKISRVADSKGTATFDIPKQAVGSEITATQAIEGAVSDASSCIVGLNAPTLSPVDEASLSITIKGEVGATITLVLPGGTSMMKVANTQGEATFSINNLKENDVIKATQTLNGQKSPEGSTIVQAKAANPPTIAPFTTADTNLVVTGEPGAKITVLLPDGTELSKTAGADGKATFNIGTQDVGAVIKATQTGSNGKTSDSASITVTQGKVAAPTINGLTTDDTTVTGTGIPGASVKVTLENGMEYTGIVKTDGTYSITIPKQAFNRLVGVTQTLNN